ncbi:KH domain-containing protein HEN4-like [Iris pallida]|uniref:KH domain-containing protein HEN4-like n=1 Tax=Iris pallida TaxID=29817 RepID=A0AAX6ETC7_IRIPA|nr:KH domain-containing protein HEN4-like [Iris pallida]
MAFPFTPSKRPFEPNPSESNGRGKWRKTAPKSQQAALKFPPGSVVYRILCPASQCGSVIGKGGGIVTRIRQETGAKVKLEEIVPGCEERVVIIIGSHKDAVASIGEHEKEGNEEKGDTDGAEDDKGNAENDEEKDEPSVAEVPKPEKAIPSAQKALLLVFERIIADDPENDGGDGESDVTARLLIFSSQVGCLLGKGGSVIKQMSSDSGAQIRILAKDDRPLCASPHDDVVQITGTVDSAKKALQSVSQLLLENPPSDSFPAANPPGPSSQPFASNPRPDVISSVNLVPLKGPPPFANRHYEGSDIPPPFSNFHESVASGQISGPPEQLIFRLLCPSDKVGSVIGKGGSIVKKLQHETGCEFKILEITPESDDRMIVISAPALPGERISPAQDGVLRAQHRIVMAVPENKESAVVSRLLVPSHQIGCLLGKGGAVIAEMRKLSGANIRILNKDQIPKNMPESDEVVQITGDFAAVQEALLQITGRLKIHLFRDKIPAMNHAGHPAFVDQMPPFGPFMGRREPSPPRMFANLPPFQREIGGRLHDERSAFVHALHSSGVPHGAERLPPAPWEGMREGAGSMPNSEYGGGIPQRRTGFAGGNHPAIITNITVDVVVPRALVPAIYGEDGYCLRRIREISEAKITITEPRPEATETVIIISGTPEQAHAAQSLLQAFVLSETGGA